MEIQRLFKPLLFLSLVIYLFKSAIGFYDVNISKSLNYINIPLIIICNILALKEIYSSNRIGLIERVMWTLVFIFPSIWNILLYFFMARPRILRKYKLLYSGVGLN